MKRVLFLLLLLSLASAQCVYYFYGDGCSHCANVKPMMDQLEAEGVEVYRFETWGNADNKLVMNYLFNKSGVGPLAQGVPAAFTGDEYLMGDVPILDNLEGKLSEKCPTLPEGVEPNGATFTNVGLLNVTHSPDEISLWVLTGAAFVDSINPCAIAVLLLLLAALMSAGNKKKALYSGLAFTVAIYIGYLMVGLGMFSAIQLTGLSGIFYGVIGFIALIIGLLNIKDYFWYRGGGFAMEIPRSWRPKLKKILDGVTNPIGAFIAGFIVLLFELPCTGGPYFFVLTLLAEKSTQAAALPLLAYYNLVFVIPLLIITGLFYFEYKQIHEMQKWKDDNIKKLHLVAGIIMAALGIWVILGVV